MKFIKKFDSHTNYNTYITSNDKILPNVCYCNLEEELHYNPFPYDQDVEYIECVDFAYINTGIKGSSEITFNLDFYMPTYRFENFGYWLFGSRISSSNSQLGFFSYTGYTSWCFGSHLNRINTDLPPGRYVFSNETSSNILTFGDRTITNNTSTWSSNLDFYLFTLNNNGALGNNGEGLRFYGGKIYSAGELVRDYIPVAKNGEGYLYDKITKTLFGNANTTKGSFIYA